MTKEQASFEWFKGVMDDVAEYDHNVCRRCLFKQKKQLNSISDLPAFNQLYLILNHLQEIIEMHNHLSCVHEEGDVRSVLITMLQQIQKSRGEEVDVVSGSRVMMNSIHKQLNLPSKFSFYHHVAFLTHLYPQIRTHFGRPNWEKVFERLALAHSGSEIGE